MTGFAKMIAVAAGALVALAGAATAAEVRVPTVEHKIVSASSTGLPVAGTVVTEERIVLAQGRGGPRRGPSNRRRGVGKGVAIGLGVLGVIGAIAASEAAAKDRRRECRRLERRCDDGSRWACREWRRECD